MNPTRWAVHGLTRLPAYALNGLGVALGIGLVHLVFGSWSPLAAVHAGSAAVCTSLGDLPDTPGRNARRLLGAAALSLLATFVVSALHGHPGALGVAVMAIAFIAMLTLAWGPRAGPVSFAPILAVVFAMATPPDPSGGLHFVWNVLGAAFYMAWALGVGAFLQPRLRRLALVSAIMAAARLLYTRAGMMLATRDLPLRRDDVEGADSAHLVESMGRRPEAASAGASSRALDQAAETLATWVAGEAALAERLQAARNLVFAVAGKESARRETAILLHLIDLRDVLLASRLDLELFGRDAAASCVLERVAEALVAIATALERLASDLRDDRTPALETRLGVLASAGRPSAAAELFADCGLGADDPRARVLPALARRVELLESALGQMQRLAAGAEEQLPLSREQLQRFVAPQAWPLAALRRQLMRSSPVLRHAVRMSLALGSAYYLAGLLPWGAHPHWLVLSVAVVLRGSLEQTLARRNARVLGTVLGCALMLGIARVEAPGLVELVFLVAVGVAHSYANVRYWLTATAATVMALLQAHLADPAAGFAIGERLADTFLGALLGWSFSYVLPSWERHALPQTIARSLDALATYAQRVLAGDRASAVRQRLARRNAYDALGALAAAAQRSAVEPRRTRLPLADIAVLLDHAQRLMAHLSSIRLTLARPEPALREADVVQRLGETARAVAAQLGAAGGASGPSPADAGFDAIEALPRDSPSDDPVPWLRRRLQLSLHDAGRVRAAADGALARLQRDGATVAGLSGDSGRGSSAPG